MVDLTNCALSMSDAVLPRISEIFENHEFGGKFCEGALSAKKPDTAYYVDMFGFSRTFADALSQMGFENLVINRIDYKDKQLRKQENRLTFYWNTSPNRTVLTHILEDHYSGYKKVHPNFKWIEVNPMKPDFLPQLYFKYFSEHIEVSARSHKFNLVYLPYGDDFTHTNMHFSFSQMESMMNILHSNPAYKNFSLYHINWATSRDYFRDIRLLSKEF